MISPTQIDVEKVVSLLRLGRVVAFPTDTLYGLGVHPFIERAVERIFQIKGRTKREALPLLLADVADLERYALEIPPVGWRLAEAFLPGSLTLVLLKSPSLPAYLTGGKSTVALRVPNHPVARSLCEGLDSAITGTSANVSGMPPCVSAEEVRSQIGPRVDLVLDVGPAPTGSPSTIVDLTSPEPRILREGAVSRCQIEQACGQLVP